VPFSIHRRRGRRGDDEHVQLLAQVTTVPPVVQHTSDGWGSPVGIGAIATAAAVIVALVALALTRRDTTASLRIASAQLAASLKPRLSMATQPQIEHTSATTIDYIARATNLGNGVALITSAVLHLSDTVHITFTPDPDWVQPSSTTTLHGSLAGAFNAPSVGVSGTMRVTYTDLRGDQGEVLVMDCTGPTITATVEPLPG
jgi:hypothetical protein